MEMTAKDADGREKGRVDALMVCVGTSA